MSNFCRLHNLPLPLVIIRKHRESVSHNKSYRQLEFAHTVRMSLLEQLNIRPSEEERSIHADICQRAPLLTNAQLACRKEWLFRIYHQNKMSKRYNQKSLNRHIEVYWWITVIGITSYDIKTFRIVALKSPMFWPKINVWLLLKIFIKSLLNYHRSILNIV